LFNFSKVKMIIRFLINSNIWVSFCALALTLSSEILLQTRNLSISQFVFFATLFAYNFQRVARIKKETIHARKNWLNKNRIAVYFLIFFAFVISAFHFLNFKFSTQIIIFSAAVLSLMYPFGLREIPFAKIFVISFVWAISTMLCLVIENDIIITKNIIFHLSSRFLFVFAITIPFDIRDLKHDIGQLKTIPLFFGEKKSKWLANFGLLICGIIAVLQRLQNNIPLSNFLALVLLYFLSLVLVIQADKKNSEMYFSFWVESLSIFSYLFLVIMLLIV
tara:strand:+ start:15009 stop:15839 length:831 start_codon:yes stop_codon:yes gene_type:complete